jgi:hypothetical protein
MNLPLCIRHAWLTQIKDTVNPLTRRLARSSVGPFSLIRHVGQRSRKTDETPRSLPASMVRSRRR